MPVSLCPTCTEAWQGRLIWDLGNFFNLDATFARPRRVCVMSAQPHPAPDAPITPCKE